MGDEGGNGEVGGGEQVRPTMGVQGEPGTGHGAG